LPLAIGAALVALAKALTSAMINAGKREDAAREKKGWREVAT